jgi:phosphoserine phosphatase
MGKNEELGLLHRDKMQKIVIAFDVDGTLITSEYLDDEMNNKPTANERIRTLLITLSSFKNTKIVVWSGGGELYAKQVVSYLALDKYVDKVMAKDNILQPDIAIDDIQDTAIGKVNLIVREK